MGIKLITTLLLVTLLSSCSWSPFKPEVQYVSKPILYCPAPPEINRPHLLIQDLTESDFGDPGKVVQYYKFSVKQLLNHNTLLENMLDQYKSTSQAYKSLEKNLDEKFPEENKETD